MTDSAPDTAPDSKGRILIIDDDVDLADSFAELLSDEGYEIEVANCAESALEIAGRFEAQIALVDIRLGKSSGLDLVQPLVATRPGIMPVMMTGNSDRESAIGAIRQGAYDFLTKPVQFDELNAALDRCFEALRLKEATAEAMRAMQAAKEEAQAADKAKSEFLASITHELRTPLNAVIGFSDILKDESLGPIGNEQYAEYAADINQAGRHLIDVISDILDMAKAEAGKLEVQEAEVDLVEIAQAAIRTMRPKAEEAAISFEANLPDESICLIGDSRKLKQILLNLLSNAIKFTPEGGSVGVELQADEDGNAAMIVADTGIGMSDEDIPKALAPFVQVDARLARQYEGTGLGLPLAVAMAKLHNGQIDVDSEIDAGTRVTVTLPAAQPEPAEAAA